MEATPSYVHGAHDVPLIGETIGSFLAGIALRHGSNDALVVPHQQVRWTYAELDERVTRLAAGLPPRALLVVDASQGVEAQTVANCYTALDLGVEVLPVLNKMDLPQADPDNAKAEIEDLSDMLGAVAAEAEWLARGDDVRFMNEVALRLQRD